ncbi:MAG TPA: hypothetical protein VGR31_15775 [Planctomycetota bacterium]|nr:hypothetical protein [Planctomycetota bacterium]
MAESSLQRFLLAVDDGGEYFAVSGPRVTIGHLRSPGADLPFLADVEAEHARLELVESFHSGPRWSLAARSGEKILVSGRFVSDVPSLLAHDDLVQLAPNLTFRFRSPDPASSSAVLDLLSGSDCQGARHVLLFAPGAGGRVRIAARVDRHVPVPELTQEVSLELEPGALVVRCAGGVRVQGGVTSTGADPALSLPCPPAQSVSLTLGARPANRAPFGITISPARMFSAGSARPRPV